jgi:hypothetical protein
LIGADQTFSCAGGSITVRTEGARIVVVSGPTPAAGYVVGEQKVESDKVEIRFDGPTEAQLKLRLRGGIIVEEADDD